MTKIIQRRPEPTEEDITRSEERTIALMHEGRSFVEAATLAAIECTQRVLDRELKAIAAAENERDRRHDQYQAKQRAEREKLRAELQARATPAQRPTLKASFGDLLAAKGGRR